MVLGAVGEAAATDEVKVVVFSTISTLAAVVVVGDILFKAVCVWKKR